MIILVNHRSSSCSELLETAFQSQHPGAGGSEDFLRRLPGVPALAAASEFARLVDELEREACGMSSIGRGGCLRPCSSLE